ncbi:unnamed protein product [Brassicogethes aeneus]|uniref:Mitochondrial ribosomal protein S34 n=1 Tax=Brassicogethes aeneus TaxID=1431903 RepID=A0A9P0AUH8_BRAAE|nr:unnamed protein product [Brassicogethes aeneus]
MPYKYIGRKHDFIGKTLWEIVGNLKNFGMGRIVARSRFERYPEPSFLKIIKVETLPNPEKPSYDDVRKVRVWVEKVFRGVKQPKPMVIESTSYKTDYKLIPKDQEDAYCRFKEVKQEHVKIVPKTVDFPPIMQELLKRDMISRGEKVTEVPKLELVYNKSSKQKYKIAEKDEKPDVNITLGLGTPISPSLYEGVKL